MESTCFFMYGIVDCDNCNVGCERVFRPVLEGKPVVVLSNNDGYVVARSNEADVFANAIKHDFRSPSPTTRWSDVIKLN